MYYTGIDMSKKSLVVVILDNEGEVVRSPVKLTVDEKGLAQLAKMLEEYQHEQRSHHRRY